MWRATLSSLLAHKLRLALTAFAIVLGVGFVSGTLIYTDTIRASFDSVFGEIGSEVDLNVRGVSALADADGGQFQDFGGEPTPVTPQVLDDVSAVEGVAAVQGNVEGVAQVLDAQGEPIGGQGPPVLGVNAPTVDELDATELRAGQYPSEPDEIALDAATARDNGFEVGNTVQVAANGPIESYELVGTFGFGEDVDNLAGASVTMFAADTALELFGTDGGYTTVDVLAADGADIDELSDRIAAAVGDDYEVVSSDELAAEAQEAVDSILGVFNNALLVFAGVSLLVGAFIINNTFAIIVAQRARELALLRAVGASKAQVVGSMLLEALVVALIASVVGVGLGVVIAIGLESLLAQFGIDLPDAELVFSLRTVLVGLAVGVVVTMGSALLPATKALRVPPVAAMQAVTTPPSRTRGRVRTALGALVFAIGLGLLGFGLFTDDAGIAVVIAGAVALLLGAALLAQYVTRPLLRVIGWPVQQLGVRGTLAEENAVRNPRRTASTASALMIGLGLVVFALIFGASLRESTTAAIDEQFASDFQVRSQNFQNFPPEVEDEVAALPEIDTTAELRVGQVGIDGRVGTVAAIEADELDAAFSLETTDGSLDAFSQGGLLITDDAAGRLDIAAGDALAVTFPQTGEQQVPVRAVIDGSGLDVDYLLTEQLFLDNVNDDGIQTLFTTVTEGTSLSAARTAIENATEPYPALNVQDSEDVKEEIAGQVNQILGLMSALLGLSILIALFGIANTLSLSVFERIRELGLLRAVGATRSQVRSIVRWESVLIAVLGALFGIVVGAVFGWMTVRALADTGVSVFAFPTGQVVVAVVVAALAGMLAAILPARRAARVDVLRALAAD